MIENLKKHPSEDEEVISARDQISIKNKTISRRSTIKRMDWDLCMFCQCTKQKVSLRSVMTEDLSQRIIESSKLDAKMSIHLSTVQDLIAAEGKYHLSCLSAFDRQIEKAKQKCVETDLAFVWLCDELKLAAGKGHVLRLSDVWDRYLLFSQDTQTTVPQSFLTRRGTCTAKMNKELEDTFVIYQPPGKSVTDRQMLLIPQTYEHVAISELITYNEEKDINEDLPRYEPEKDDIFLQLVHVALKLRSDLLAKQGHNGLTVSEEGAIDCVPESVYMFLQLLFGGQALLDRENPEEEEECNPTIGHVNAKVLNVAQDMVYGVSCGKKWTPKHIGLASTLHQATR